MEWVWDRSENLGLSGTPMRVICEDLAVLQER